MDARSSAGGRPRSGRPGSGQHSGDPVDPPWLTSLRAGASAPPSTDRRVPDPPRPRSAPWDDGAPRRPARASAAELASSRAAAFGPPRRPASGSAAPATGAGGPGAVGRGRATTRTPAGGGAPTGRSTPPDPGSRRRGGGSTTGTTDANGRAGRRGGAGATGGAGRKGGRGRTASRPATDPPPPRGGRLLRRLRIAAVLASTLVLVLTGTAWGLYRDITAGIVTTDVIVGGGDGGDQNILLVGVDSRTDAQGRPLPPEILRELNSGADTGVLNSDTIMLLHVPEDGGAAVAFSIPRDAYVDIPGYRRDKINAAYPAVKAITAERLVAEGTRGGPQLEAESARAGRTALIGAVERLTGTTVDHYAEINLVGFYDLTRAIGGVDVCLAAAVDEPLSGARLPAGPQTISGRDALAFVRQRHGLPDGDLSRIRRQQVFLAAVADKVLSAGTLTDPTALGGLIDVVQQSVVLDEGWDLLQFAQQASDIAAGNLEFVTIPTEGNEHNARGDVVLVDTDRVEAFVEERIVAQRAASEAAAAASEVEPLPPVDVIAGRYIVDVRNGSGITGLAGDTAAHLVGRGFTGGTVDNAETSETTTVRYTGPDGDAAQAVADQLGGVPVERDDTVAQGHLLVMLGTDFDRAVVPVRQDDAPPPTEAPPPAVDAPITAAGVPCID